MKNETLRSERLNLTYASQIIEIKRDVEPIWSKIVPRWYQLDDAAYALAEWGSHIELPQPELILFYVKRQIIQQKPDIS